MIQPFDSKYLTPTKKFRRLSVMLAIHNTPKISQHKIGQITHLSSSMVNNYIKKLQQKGDITVNGKTNRTLSYHLTSSGHNQLTSMLLEYSAEIIQLYATTKREVSERLRSLKEEGISKVALFGASETAEVVYTAIKHIPLTVSAIVDSDPSKQGKQFNGLVIQKPEILKSIVSDAIVITSFARQEEIYKEIIQLVGEGVKVKKLSDL